MLHDYLNTNWMKVIIEITREKYFIESVAKILKFRRPVGMEEIELKVNLTDISHCSNYYHYNTMASKPSDGLLVFGKIVFYGSGPR